MEIFVSTSKSFPESPIHMLSSPMKNGYSGDPMLEAALDEDSDTLGDSLDDLMIAKH